MESFFVPDCFFLSPLRTAFLSKSDLQKWMTIWLISAEIQWIADSYRHLYCNSEVTESLMWQCPWKSLWELRYCILEKGWVILFCTLAYVWVDLINRFLPYFLKELSLVPCLVGHGFSDAGWWGRAGAASSPLAVLIPAPWLCSHMQGMEVPQSSSWALTTSRHQDNPLGWLERLVRGKCIGSM